MRSLATYTQTIMIKRLRFFILAALLLTVIPVYAQHLKIFHIDVDQGDATLFVTPNGSTMLVDAGKNGHGERIKKILDQEGISCIDYFVNTHYHEDHYGGIDELVNLGVYVGVAYDRGDKDFLPPKKLKEKTYKDYQDAVGSKAIMLTSGTDIPIDPALSVRCISHGGVVLGETEISTAKNENDMSLSLLITYGNFKYFIGGDVEEHTERKIAERDLVLDVDVYQANHHGSHTSSSWGFLQDLMPAVVVISNGSNNSYYHPRQVTLDNFNRLTPTPIVFQTNKYMGRKAGGGNVPDEFIADLDTTGDEGTITLLVNLHQNTYTITYRDQTKNFPVKPRAVTEVQPKGIVIEKLMPDPPGADALYEYVIIKNKTAHTVSLAGWVLRDAGNKVWLLDGLEEIQPGQSLKIVRNNMPMSLNNTGDTIMLVNPANVVIDEFRYTGSVEGVDIVTGH
ncbi:MAG: lamin tail domain-containing protein [Cyclobacteriaceae bacterium]|nr:lamin tail domain-containing protein [Cyclobacteriaceae bacterium]